MQYMATILFVEPESNPEEAVVPIEASSIAEARKQAQEILSHTELRGLKRRSFADESLWGKVQRTLVDIRSKEEYEAMAGAGGNSPGPRWPQDAHHAFLRDGEVTFKREDETSVTFTASERKKKGQSGAA